MHVALNWLAQRFLKLTPRPALSHLLKRTTGPTRFLLPLLSGFFALPLAAPGPHIMDFLRNIFSLCLIGGVAWLFIGVLNGGEEFLQSHYKLEEDDNLRARKVHTQLGMLKRIVIMAVVFIAFASMLMVFERVRQVGASILASAGIASVVVGFAAQRSIATVLAGLQVAITQPIRLDDVLVVENEWGRVEEITLTYVVVKIWDERRLVLPVSYFIEKPFQNWTRVSAQVLGTVLIHADYGVPVEELRRELKSIVEASELWDRRVCGLQVTEAGERSLELRALVSARDAGRAWDLRCLVRERLIAYLRDNFPHCLPRLRAELDRPEPQAG